MLDVFACTGGFSVNAAAGGATEVHSVDLSRRSLATARATQRPMRLFTAACAMPIRLLNGSANASQVPARPSGAGGENTATKRAVSLARPRTRAPGTPG